MPLYHENRTAGTSRRHSSITTALPHTTTTTVLVCRAETSRMSSTSAGGRRSDVRSPPRAKETSPLSFGRARLGFLRSDMLCSASTGQWFSRTYSL
jgi:hypothetical protein